MRRLLPYFFVLGCTLKNEAAQPVPSDPVREAAARVDVALMHDYRLVAETRHPDRYTLPLPALPSIADDTSFLRRACIDLAGRLPRPDEVRTFVADQTPDKRRQLTDALTREAGAGEVRFRMLAEAFRVTDEDAETIAWLREAAAKDYPYAEIIAVMIGGGLTSRRDGGDAMRTSVETAYSVLGVNNRCAMCHDHPFNDRTEMETYEFAACFTGPGQAMRLPHDYKYPRAEPGDVVMPALPRLTRSWPPGIRDDADKRVQVAHWITEQEVTKRFALVAVMRSWRALFGMPGQIIDPTVGGVDDEPSWQETRGNCFYAARRGSPTWIDMDISEPGDFSQATKVMMEEFLRCEGRIGEYQRILASTEAYSRSGIGHEFAWRGCLLPPAPQIRRLPSEVIWKTLTAENDMQLPQVPQQGHPLRLLGRGTREWTDESETPVSHELARFMMNDKLIDQATAKAGDAEGMFLELLGREPTENERAAILRTAATDEDVAWALLNTKEFMFRP
jgi:hypothetical protein